MNITHRELAEGIYLVNLSGPLNIKQAEKVSQGFQKLSAQGIERVIVNMANVPFIDARGLAALTIGYKIFGSRKQNFQLAGLQTQPKLVFELTGFDRIFQIFDNVDEVTVTSPQNQARPSNNPATYIPPLAVVDMAA